MATDYTKMTRDGIVVLIAMYAEEANGFPCGPKSIEYWEGMNEASKNVVLEKWKKMAEEERGRQHAAHQG